jgi:hypothetical protein
MSNTTMKIFRIPAGLILIVLALAVSASTAKAQIAEAAASAIAQPIITKVVKAVLPKDTPPGTNWLKAEVIYADANSMMVREQANEIAIHTFNFAPDVKARMQTIFEKGGYQYGDKVSILLQPGQTVALRVVGKPSKPF